MDQRSFLGGRVTLYAGDCLAVLDTLPENSIDACVTDPPYHLASIVKRFGKEGSAPVKVGDVNASNDLKAAYARASAGFMGKQWDGGDVAFRVDTWAKVLRVLKPGAHLVAFGAPKNYHRLACAIEDAGFEIRDSLMWLFGSGFPKSHNLDGDWEGWGSALKPAFEPIVFARKPLSEKTIIANVLRWGTGALNIDGCRVQGGGASSPRGSSKLDTDANEGWMRPWMNDRAEVARREAAAMDRLEKLGRWPANIAHDGSDEVLAAFPAQTSVTGKRSPRSQAAEVVGTAWLVNNHTSVEHTDSGSAARFFYSAKADKQDRIGSKHPTIKPIDLMQWLCRLITPPKGCVLDLFAGTGTTGEAAWREGFSAVLIEREEEYRADIERRMRLCLAGPDERSRESIKARGNEAFPGPLFNEATS